MRSDKKSTSCNSNSSGRDIVKTVGYITVRYGATAAAVTNSVFDQSAARKLAFASPKDVYEPLDNTRLEI